MDERQLLENITSYMKEVSVKAWRAHRRLTNSPDTSETFGFVSYPLLTFEELEALRVASWESVRAINQLYDCVRWMAGEKKAGRDIEDAEEE